MRLLHTNTFHLYEFFDRNIPPYAILSHRWEEDEVSLQDLKKGRKKNGAGYLKILSCCARAATDGYDWIWIDTCCIDKSSSADLSEAINSMFRWYRDAGICYAYLSDVRDRSEFRQSAWFTRGWTLQELLAPRNMRFLNAFWHIIGTKDSLSDEIAAITGIEERYVRHFGLPTCDDASVATRMSWAARRETSRTEDMAYCLIGIFNVNMPLLYGEGKRAFLRLQLQIIKTSDDESIFAWTSNEGAALLFARGPSDFARSGDIGPFVTESGERPPYSMTNKGLQIVVRLKTEFEGSGSQARYLLPLNCRRKKSRYPISIFVQSTGTGSGTGSSPEKSMVRRYHTQLKEVKDYEAIETSPGPETIYIKVW